MKNRSKILKDEQLLMFFLFCFLLENEVVSIAYFHMEFINLFNKVFLLALRTILIDKIVDLFHHLQGYIYSICLLEFLYHLMNR